MRIMCQMLAKMPFKDLPNDYVTLVLDSAFEQSNKSILMAENDYILSDFALTYSSCFARALAKHKTDDFQIPQEQLQTLC